LKQNVSDASLGEMEKFRNRWGGLTLGLEVGICALGLSNIWWQMLVFFPFYMSWMMHVQRRAST
jgi:hypothetical protein